MPPTLPQDLLDKLACPRCRGPLELKDDGRALDCTACQLRYAVDVEEDFAIPNLLVEEARPLSETTS